MKRITIGLFTDAFFPMTDGVVMVVDNYAKRLIKYGDVYVFAPSYNEKYDDSKLPYKVIRCKSVKVPFIDYSLPLPKLDTSYLPSHPTTGFHISSIFYSPIHSHSFTHTG